MSKAFFSPGRPPPEKRTGKRAEILRRKMTGNPVRTGLPNNFGRQKRGRSCGPVSGLFFCQGPGGLPRRRKIVRIPRPPEKRPVPPQNSGNGHKSRAPPEKPSLSLPFKGRIMDYERLSPLTPAVHFTRPPRHGGLHSVSADPKTN